MKLHNNCPDRVFADWVLPKGVFEIHIWLLPRYWWLWEYGNRPALWWWQCWGLNIMFWRKA